MKNCTPYRPNTSAFTLVELLLVIGILAVLSTTAVLVLNPAQLIAQGRDAKRVNDLHLLDQALSVYQTQGGTSFGTLQRVYISLPDSSATCATYTSLPTLPSPWIYQCATAANYRRVDGSGWLPVNLASTNTLTASVLPIDPINTEAANSYYTYIPGSWNLTAPMESGKYLRTTSLSDGGLDPSRLEAGSDKSLWTTASGLVGYWPLDEGSGTSASDLSGNNNTGTLTNGPTWTASTSCKVGACLSFDGVDDYVDISYSSAVALDNSFSISFWIYITSDPNVGASNEWRSLFRKQTGSTGPFYMYLEEPMTINFTLIKGGVSYRYIDTSFASEQLAVGQWTHLAYTYNSATGIAAAYKNGAVSRSGPMRNGSGGPAIPTGALDSSAIGWRISNNPGAYPPSSGNGSLPARLDDARTYNRALAATEISAIYSAGR